MKPGFVLQRLSFLLRIVFAVRYVNLPPKSLHLHSRALPPFFFFWGSSKRQTLIFKCSRVRINSIFEISPHVSALRTRLGHCDVEIRITKAGLTTFAYRYALLQDLVLVTSPELTDPARRIPREGSDHGDTFLGG